jgi:hypothetical protein
VEHGIEDIESGCRGQQDLFKRSNRRSGPAQVGVAKMAEFTNDAAGFGA